jgi:thymidylate synthase ThyX
MPQQTGPRVLTVAPMPPEKIAYALARYSRSPDSITDSIEWVRTHDSSKFLESFYFQYGHASIADLGHLVVCFEGVSELAATEIEDEQLWDGQARSSRYQNFGKSGLITPPEFDVGDAAKYERAGTELLDAYHSIHARLIEHLTEKLPRPANMKPEAYSRNIAARAFDVARYCLFFGIPTGVGQVVSIRTLERQIRRMRGSQYRGLISLGDEAASACAQPPACGEGEPLAPTLANYVDPDEHKRRSREDLRAWTQQNLPSRKLLRVEPVDLVRPSDPLADISATLLYSVTDRPYRELYEMTSGWSRALCREVIDVALRSRSRRDELLREFRTQTFAFDIVMDLGAYRDLHRHRRCQQFRQDYSTALGYATPQAILDAGLNDEFRTAMARSHGIAIELPAPGSHYILPFATNSRFLFKMDLAEAEYVSRLRSGVKGHFSYREIAWKMREKLAKLEPELGELVEATPPWVEDPLTR